MKPSSIFSKVCPACGDLSINCVQSVHPWPQKKQLVGHQNIWKTLRVPLIFFVESACCFNGDLAVEIKRNCWQSWGTTTTITKKQHRHLFRARGTSHVRHLPPPLQAGQPWTRHDVGLGANQSSGNKDCFWNISPKIFQCNIVKWSLYNDSTFTVSKAIPTKTIWSFIPNVFPKKILALNCCTLFILMGCLHWGHGQMKDLKFGGARNQAHRAETSQESPKSTC